MIRRVLRRMAVQVHRYSGLLIAMFLVIVSLTGSLLAFYPELHRLANPHWYPAHGAESRLSPGELAALLESAEPQARVTYVQAQGFEGATRAWVEPRKDPTTGAAYTIGYEYAVLDPVTGSVIERGRWGGISDNWRLIMDFVYELHYSLVLGMFGVWTLGIVAVVWTINAFVGLILTLPTGDGDGRSCWERWRTAWRVKRGVGAFRLGFDLHRACGLWLWAMLLVFAWSSVYMNLWDTVYTWTTRVALDFRPRWVLQVPAAEPVEHPKLGWRDAQAVASRLMAEQAAQHGFTVGRPVELSYDAEIAAYTYSVQSSLDINDRPRRYGAQVTFDGDSGDMRHVLLPRGQYSGNTVSNWLYALHMGNVFGLPYRILVSVFGLAVVVLSAAGCFIWWRKRQARRSAADRRVASSTSDTTPR